MMAAKRAFDRVRGVLKFNEPMARHTTWRVGGPAQRYFEPADLQDLQNFLARLADDEPLFWLGLGSNLLVRDGGIRGTVIATSGLLNEMSFQPPNRVRLEAGVSCAKAARFCGRQGLVGAEFLAGIPGTIGGALAMNAGAFGGETWALVESVEMLTRRGELKRRSPDEFEVAYRHVKTPDDEFFVAVHFRLETGDAEAAAARIKTLLERRAETQPIGKPSCGSVFRNPKGDFAARLIEACGLKGACKGDACVSEKHANFIINTGTATASDIEALIEEIKATVMRQQGVQLVPEVHIVGEA